MSQSPYSEVNEDQLINVLQDSLKDSSKERQIKRRFGLEEILRRVKSGSFENVGALVNIVLDVAAKYGHDQPEGALITDILVIAVDKDEEILNMIIEYADRLVESESKLFLVFPELVLKFDYKQQQTNP